MKITRASAHDAENLLDLLQKTSNLLQQIEIMRNSYRDLDEHDYHEMFEVIAAADKVRVMPFKDMTTAALNLIALLDPANQVTDPDSLLLQPHPNTHADTARLDFLIRKGGAALLEIKSGGWEACSTSYLIEEPKWEGYGINPRSAIDAAMRKET